MPDNDITEHEWEYEGDNCRTCKVCSRKEYKEFDKWTCEPDFKAEGSYGFEEEHWTLIRRIRYLEDRLSYIKRKLNSALADAEIQDCPVCKHATLQVYMSGKERSDNISYCVTCGHKLKPATGLVQAD